MTTLLFDTITLILFQCWYEAQTWHTRSILSYSFAFWRLTILPHVTMYRPRSLGSMHENTKDARCAFDSGPRLVPSQACGSTIYDDGTCAVYTMLENHKCDDQGARGSRDAVLGGSAFLVRGRRSFLMLSCLMI